MIVFEIGNRVKKDKVLKVENALGVVEKVTSDYVVVQWDEVNGHWHYTHEQAQNKLEIINEQK